MTAADNVPGGYYSRRWLTACDHCGVLWHAADGGPSCGCDERETDDDCDAEDVGDE